MMYHVTHVTGPAPPCHALLCRLVCTAPLPQAGPQVHTLPCSSQPSSLLPSTSTPISPLAPISGSRSGSFGSISGHRGFASKIQVEYVKMEEPTRDQYTTRPTNYVQLLGALRQARNVARLAELVGQFGRTFDAVHVAAALTRLPKLANYRCAVM